MPHQLGGGNFRRGKSRLSEKKHRNPIDSRLSPGHKEDKRHSPVAFPKDHASASQSAAYEDLLKARKGTPAYDRALFAFVLELFPDSSAPTGSLPPSRSSRRSLCLPNRAASSDMH